MFSLRMKYQHWDGGGPGTCLFFKPNLEVITKAEAIPFTTLAKSLDTKTMRRFHFLATLQV